MPKAARVSCINPTRLSAASRTSTAPPLPASLAFQPLHALSDSPAVPPMTSAVSYAGVTHCPTPASLPHALPSPQRLPAPPLCEVMPTSSKRHRPLDVSECPPLLYSEPYWPTSASLTEEGGQEAWEEARIEVGCDADDVLDDVQLMETPPREPVRRRARRREPRSGYEGGTLPGVVPLLCAAPTSPVRDPVSGNAQITTRVTDSPRIPSSGGKPPPTAIICSE